MTLRRAQTFVKVKGGLSSETALRRAQTFVKADVSEAENITLGIEPSVEGKPRVASRL